MKNKDVKKVIKGMNKIVAEAVDGTPLRFSWFRDKGVCYIIADYLINGDVVTFRGWSGHNKTFFREIVLRESGLDKKIKMS